MLIQGRFQIFNARLEVTNGLELDGCGVHSFLFGGAVQQILAPKFYAFRVVLRIDSVRNNLLYNSPHPLMDVLEGLNHALFRPVGEIQSEDIRTDPFGHLKDVS